MRIKSALSRLNVLGGRLHAAELLVLNYHGTQKKFMPNLRKQFEYLTERFDVITPATFRQYYRNASSLPSGKPRLLLSFDDGIKNNLFALELLNEYGLKAFFFIIPGFINTAPEEQKAYFLQHIRPEINKHIDHEPEDFLSLSWADLKSALSDGHGIGCHTFSHTLTHDDDHGKLRHEIVESKAETARHLSVTPDTIDCFCSPNKTLLSTGKEAYQLISNHYDYFFTSFAGSNMRIHNPLLICRTNVEAFWPKGAFMYAVGKLDWIRWSSKIRSFRKMVADGGVIKPT